MNWNTFVEALNDEEVMALSQELWRAREKILKALAAKVEMTESEKTASRKNKIQGIVAVRERLGTSLVETKYIVDRYLASVGMTGYDNKRA